MKALKVLLFATFCAMIASSCVPRVARPVQEPVPDGPPAIRPPVVTPDSVAVSEECTDELSRLLDKELSHISAVPTEEDTRFGTGFEVIEFERIEDYDEYMRRQRETDPHTPTAGGKATIYLQRGFMDDAITEMVRLHPFEVQPWQGKGAALFHVTDSTHRRLVLRMGLDELRRANGRRITSLEFIDLWSRFIEARPAQGMALFRNVQGVESFIEGTSPLVNGFTAVDEHTIQIRFATPDPLAFHRLNTSKLIGAPFMLGLYHPGGTRDAEMRLLPNANSMANDIRRTTFLDECTIRMGGDQNAIGSFALGRYSAMTLYTISDLDMAQTELANETILYKLPGDRYFLSCKSDGQACGFVRGTINSDDILKNHVKADGEVIYSVIMQKEAAGVRMGSIPPPQLPHPFRIIYREDDPISAVIAHKISEDLNNAGMETELINKNAKNYEIALMQGEYNGAVGWVSEIAMGDITEQLHLATMWFADEANSELRLREYREIPLFSVNNYLLLRDNIKLHGNRLSGMWISEHEEGTKQWIMEDD